MANFFTRITIKPQNIRSDRECINRDSFIDDDQDCGDDEPPPLEMICLGDPDSEGWEEYATELVNELDNFEQSETDITDYVSSIKYLEGIKYETSPIDEELPIMVSEIDWYVTQQFDADEADETKDEKQMADARSPINQITVMLLKG